MVGTETYGDDLGKEHKLVLFSNADSQHETISMFMNCTNSVVCITAQHLTIFAHFLNHHALYISVSQQGS